MEVKLFEVRDRATFMPMMAVKLSAFIPKDKDIAPTHLAKRLRERYLLRRAGFSAEQIDPSFQIPHGYPPYVVLVKLDGIEAQYDPYNWRGIARTLPTVHKHIIDNWDILNSGDVIDVEFILGETSEPKKSEQVTAGEVG